MKGEHGRHTNTPALVIRGCDQLVRPLRPHEGTFYHSLTQRRVVRNEGTETAALHRMGSSRSIGGGQRLHSGKVAANGCQSALGVGQQGPPTLRPKPWEAWHA